MHSKIQRTSAASRGQFCDFYTSTSGDVGDSSYWGTQLDFYNSEPGIDFHGATFFTIFWHEHRMEIKNEYLNLRLSGTVVGDIYGCRQKS